MPQLPQTVRIIHFDDEVNAVCSISNSLLALYQTHRGSWICDSEIDYTNWVEGFVIRPPGKNNVKVVYTLTEDEEYCKKLLSAERGSLDLAFFDLMRQGKKGIEAIGSKLYEKAKEVGFEDERLFILTGFPGLFDQFFPNITIPETRKLLKPTSPMDIARRIMTLLPSDVHID